MRAAGWKGALAVSDERDTAVTNVGDTGDEARSRADLGAPQ